MNRVKPFALLWFLVVTVIGVDVLHLAACGSRTDAAKSLERIYLYISTEVATNASMDTGTTCSVIHKIHLHLAVNSRLIFKSFLFVPSSFLENDRPPDCHVGAW